MTKLRAGQIRDEDLITEDELAAGRLKSHSSFTLSKRTSSGYTTSTVNSTCQ